MSLQDAKNLYEEIKTSSSFDLKGQFLDNLKMFTNDFTTDYEASYKKDNSLQ